VLFAPNRAESPSRSRPPACPHRSFTILEESKHILSIKFWVLSQLAVLPTGKPCACGDPKTPIAGGEQVSNIAAGEVLTRWRPPLHVPNSIEAKQAEFRAEPQITVGRLSNCVDGAFEKAVSDRPRVVRVLIDVERWI
jgi:hypothetical protein